jgi:hypothetical protein
MANASFSSVWFYSQDTELTFDLNTIGFPIEGITIHRDLKSFPFYLRNGTEPLKIDDTLFVQYKFPRELKFYI